MSSYKEVQAGKEEGDFKYQTNQKVQSIEFAIKKINETLNSIFSEFKSNQKYCEIQTYETKNMCIDTLNGFTQKIGDFRSEIQAFKWELSGMHSDLNCCVNDLEFDKKTTILEEAIRANNRLIESMKIEFNGLIDRQKADFVNQLKALREEILSRPSEVPELRKFIDQKIELVELNGQNALLRSSNNEKQIMLVERKIDNIYQLIKKLELSKQE